MKKHKLALRVVLPSDAAACEACVERLVQALANTPGIASITTHGVHGPLKVWGER